MQSEIRNDYLSKENANCMKFIFAVAIVFCHLFAYDPFGKGVGIGAIITSFGYLSVSAFLFFSGYGLTVQYKSKGNVCFDGYFQKRLLPIYVIQVLLIVLYTLFKLGIGYSVSCKTVLQSFLFGNTVIQYGWYLQMILLFYVVYYFCFFRRTIKIGIVLLSISILVYCLICFVIKMPSNWYEASFSFVVGAMWAYKKEKIDVLMNVLHKYILAFFSVWSIFAVTFVLGNSGILIGYLKLPFKMMSSASFVVIMLLVIMKVRIRFKPIEFAGKFYFEIYFLQGFVILFFNEAIFINNMLLRYLICFISLFVMAICVKPVVNKINNMCKGDRT